MTTDIEQLTFEDALTHLETTLAQLESGELDLDAALTLYEKGQKLAQHCQQKLDTATLKVEQLSTLG